MIFKDDNQLWEKAGELVGRELKTKRQCSFNIIGISADAIRLTIGKDQRQISYSRELTTKFCRHRANGGEITPESLSKADVHFAKKQGYSYLPIIVDEILDICRSDFGKDLDADPLKEDISVNVNDPDIKSIVVEGKERTIVQTVYERKIRDKAIKHYGTKCMVCDLDLNGVYSPAYAGSYIEVHHLNPLAQQAGPVETSIEDVIVVCSNCHRIIHKRKNVVLDWKILRDAIFERRRRNKIEY